MPLSDEDVLALLDGLGVAGTHDPEDDQEAVAASDWAGYCHELPAARRVGAAARLRAFCAQRREK